MIARCSASSCLRSAGVLLAALVISSSAGAQPAPPRATGVDIEVVRKLEQARKSIKPDSRSGGARTGEAGRGEGRGEAVSAHVGAG